MHYRVQISIFLIIAYIIMPHKIAKIVIPMIPILFMTLIYAPQRRALQCEAQQKIHQNNASNMAPTYNEYLQLVLTLNK